MISKTLLRLLKDFGLQNQAFQYNKKKHVRLTKDVSLD